METLTVLNHYSDVLVRFAWIMFVQSSILIVVLLGLDLLLRKRVQAVFRYCLWMLVLVKLVLPVGLALPYTPAYWVSDMFPDGEVTKHSSSDPIALDTNLAEVSRSNTDTAPAVSSTSTASVEPVTMSTPIVSSPSPSASPPMISMQASSDVSISWSLTLSLVWLMAVLVMLGLLIQRLFLVRSLVRQANPSDEALCSLLQSCISSMSMRRQVDIRLSSNATSPSVCGLVFPVILIPDHLSEQLDTQQMHAILMHELAHIKRGDLWINLVQALLQILYFYHGPLWVANAIIRRIREQAVDEMVLAAMEDKADIYPETLLDVSKLVWSKPMLSLRLIGVVESKSALTARIQHMLSKPFPKTAKIGLLGFMVLLFAAVNLLPMAKGSARHIPFDEELSQVSGISIKRNTNNSHDGVTGRSSSGSSHCQQKIYSEKLAKILRAVSRDYPVVIKTKLPRGTYALDAEVYGDKRMLLERVCLAFSQAFDVDVSIRPFTQKVLVLTCPDPDKLLLKKSERDLSCGFYKQERESVNNILAKDSVYREKFIVDVDELTSFVARQILANNDHKLTLVNETQLPGLYEGSIQWSPSQEKEVLQSLEAMGFKITKARRTVESIVVSKKGTTQQGLLQVDGHDTLPSELVLATHAYHQTDQVIHFTLEQKRESQVQFNRLPSMVWIIDGQEYKSSFNSNPYAAVTSHITTNSIRIGKDKITLSPGKHTASILFKEHDIVYHGKEKHVKLLRSNEVVFEVVDDFPDDYFKAMSITNAQEILDACYIQFLYQIGPTQDPEAEYEEHIKIKGYTPPFNIAAKVYVQAESGKKVYIKDLAIVSTVGEVLHNNTFSHSLHEDFSGNESKLSTQELLNEKWRIVLEPSQAIAQTHPLIRRYCAQTYYGPYRDIQMDMEIHSLRNSIFHRRSHHPVSNFQRDLYQTLDLDKNQSSRKTQNADLHYQADENSFALATNSGVAALKLDRTLSLKNLTAQMTSAVGLLSQEKGNVQTIPVRDGHMDMYAIRSSDHNYYLLTMNGIEHNQNGISTRSHYYIEYWQFVVEKDSANKRMLSEVIADPGHLITLNAGVAVRLIGLYANMEGKSPDELRWWTSDGQVFPTEKERKQRRLLQENKTF